MSEKVINNSEENLENSSQFNGDFDALLANYKQLQKELQVQENKLKNQEDKITSLESANKTLSQYIAKLEFQQSKLLRLVFGSQSEKGQKILQDQADNAIQNNSKNNTVIGEWAVIDELDPEVAKFIQEQEEEAELKKQKKSARPKGRLPNTKNVFSKEQLLNSNLPKVESWSDENKEVKCPKCGSEHLTIIGEIVESVQLVRIPARYEVHVVKSHTYKCEDCTNNGNDVIFQYDSGIKLPMRNTCISGSVIASILTDKYARHLPLYRICNEMKEQGLDVHLSTLCKWIRKACNDYFEYITDYMHEYLLMQHHIHADETILDYFEKIIRKTDNKVSKKKKRSYLWVYCSGSWESKQIHLYDFGQGRAGKNAINFLQGYEGFVHTDMYSGYDKLIECSNDTIKRCGCYTHIRRNFIDIIEHNKRQKTSFDSHAVYVLRLISILFYFEKRIKNKTTEERLSFRQKMSRPLVDRIFDYCRDCFANNKVLPKSEIGAAMRYALNNEEYFRVFLTDGNCDISNNLAERSVRPVTISRKNWLFAGSEQGAKDAAVIFSLIETAKVNNLSPYKYLEYILDNMPYINPRTEKHKLENFVPWSPEVQAHCK